MTDTPEPLDPTTGLFNDYFVQEAARDLLRAVLLPINKAAVFDALAAAEIVIVVVSFDGCGDSGQIESVDARDTAGDAALPKVAVEICRPSYSAGNIDREAAPLPDAIESMAYDILDSTHCGWENNDGAFGEFTFDVAARTISLDHNDRYVAIESYSHEF